MADEDHLLINGDGDNENIASFDMDSSPADVDMESVLGTGNQNVDSKFLTTRRKELSTSSLCPSMVLSWHGITARPRREKSLIPLSRLRAIFSGSNKEIDHTHKQRHILNHVYGIAHPGEVLALMGASGAGKTTLLNILTHRNLSTVHASGYIRLNGTEVDKHVLRRVSAYVQQDDLFIGTMTVIEHLRFMAKLRMGKHYSAHERERRVQNVMSELGLKNCANTIIGWPHRLKGLSGGERKRLAFASEIMTGPPILFCDEPTSGLDSYLAQQVIQVLKDLAKQKNMTIIVTIHQPSSQVFEMFDKICLLADGKLAFLGTIDVGISFFDSLGFSLPENFNPADHFISTLAVEGSKAEEGRERIHKICDAFTHNELLDSTTQAGSTNTLAERQQHNEQSNSQTSSSTTLSISSSEAQSENRDGTLTRKMGTDQAYEFYVRKTMERYKSTWFQQFSALTKRSFLVTLREPMLLKVRLFQTLLIGILLGAIYFQTPIRQSTVMNINGLIFQAVANMNFLFQFAAVYIFCDELPIFMREHLSYLYRVDAYFLAKNVAEAAQYLLYPIIFSTIVYWMSGFVRDAIAFAFFLLTCVLVTNVAVSISYAASCIFGTIEVATAVMPIMVIPLLAFGGFYINQASLPVYFYPLKFLSYFGYAYETAAINQWTRVDYIEGCNSTQLVKAGSTAASLRCYRDGLDVLESLSFAPENMLFDYSVMLSMIISFRVIAFSALWLRAAARK